MNQLEIFEAALERMKQSGHIKTVWYQEPKPTNDYTRCYCVGGVVGSVISGQANFCSSNIAPEDFLWDSAMKTFEIANNIGDGDHDLCEYMSWNDHPDRTKEDVIVALQKTVDYIKAKAE
jgi:hypothetical protein